MSERTIFMIALDIDDPEKRTAYLAEACGGDAQLRGRVEALIRSHESASNFLEGKAISTYATGDQPDTGPRGTLVGQFHQALLYLGVEDLAGYGAACAAMLRQFSGGNNAEELYLTAWTRAQAPNVLDDLQQAIEKVERTAAAERREDRESVHGYHRPTLELLRREAADRGITTVEAQPRSARVR